MEGATPIGTRLSDLAYGYDPGGNVTSIDDGVTPERSAIYGYDSMGRMNMMVADPGPGGGSTAASYSYTGGTNQLASLTAGAGGPANTRAIAYDARGNPTGEARPGGQSVSLDYDGHGRLISYARSGEATLTHSYNGMDDRIATTTLLPGTTPDTRLFVYAPDGRVLGEYGASASDVRAEFIWMSPEVGQANSFGGGDDGLGGYMPLAVAANDNGNGSGTPILAWVHANHMGVPSVYTDSSGAQITPPTGYSAPGFPGQSRTLADLYHNRYRDYDPTTGRYIQADPIGLEGGASPYSYALNSPLRYTDPKGLAVLAAPAAGAVGGASSGGIAAFCASGPWGWVVCGGGAVIVVGALIWYNWDDDCPEPTMLPSGGVKASPPFQMAGAGKSRKGKTRDWTDAGSYNGDWCDQRYSEEEKLCRENYGNVWGYDHFSYQGCIERAKTRKDMCRRGLQPPPRWSDGDVTGEPLIPTRSISDGK